MVIDTKKTLVIDTNNQAEGGFWVAFLESKRVSPPCWESLMTSRKVAGASQLGRRVTVLSGSSGTPYCFPESRDLNVSIGGGDQSWSVDLLSLLL